MNGMADRAIDLFKQIEHPNEIIVNLLFNAYAALGTEKESNLVKTISKNMSKSSYSNSPTVSCLLDALMKWGDIDHAQSLFNASKNKALSMYGAMMKDYIKKSMAERAIELFNEVKTPDEITTNLFFNGCAQLGTKAALNMTKSTAEKMPKSFYSNSYVLTSLLDALMECGDVEHAQSLFNSSTNKVPSMYGAMMKGCMKNKMPERAIELFNQVEIQDEILINLFFNACAQLGTKDILDKVKTTVEKIPKSFYSNTYILSSLLDVLMKCGDIEHAQSLFDSSTNKVPSMYGAMMKGETCRIYIDVQ